MADTMANIFSEAMNMGLVIRERTPREVCNEIASFLQTNPDAWCKGTIARAGDDNPLGSPDDPSARKWCAIGLIAHFTGRDRDLLERTVQHCSRAITPPNSVPIRLELYNDQKATKLEDIVAMFQCAALLPRTYDEIVDPEEEQALKQKVAYGFNESAPVPWFAWGSLESPPPEPMIEGLPKLSASALEKVMDDIAERHKALVPWSTIMAQIKGDSMAA